MPQATFLCIDSSDFMRNGDYSPNRIMAVQEATNLYVMRLKETNPENVFGFLTFGGKACTVRETLTDDVDRVTGSMASISVGDAPHFAHGIQIGMLALSHVRNTRSEKDLVVFVGSPVLDSPERLAQLAKALRKDEVGISIISLGCPANTEALQQFVDAVGRNAYLYVVPEGGSVLDFLFSTPLMGGDGGGGGAPGGAAAMMGGMGMGGDMADDPELAAALRASIEDMQRQQQQAAAGGGQQDGAAAPPAAAGGGGDSAAAGGGGGQSMAGTGPTNTEDDLELALRLSMEEALRAEQQQSGGASGGAGGGGGASTTTAAAPGQDGAAAGSGTAAGTGGGGGGANDLAEFEAAIQDPDVMAQLQQLTDGDNNNNQDSSDQPPPSSGKK